jgi:hypothetical protein
MNPEMDALRRIAAAAWNRDANEDPDKGMRWIDIIERTFAASFDSPLVDFAVNRLESIAQFALLSNEPYRHEHVLVLERKLHASVGADSGDGYGPSAHMPIVQPVLFPRVKRQSYPWRNPDHWWRGESAVMLVTALIAVRRLTRHGIPAKLVDHETANLLDSEKLRAAPGYLEFRHLREPGPLGPYDVIILDCNA